MGWMEGKTVISVGAEAKHGLHRGGGGCWKMGPSREGWG